MLETKHGHELGSEHTVSGILQQKMRFLCKNLFMTYTARPCKFNVEFCTKNNDRGQNRNSGLY